MTDGPIRVLICEDQQLIRAGYVAVLGAQPDMEVVGQAANGREALTEIGRLHPDVVVMDIQMPLLDGIEVTRRVAGLDAATPAKVLIVTTFNIDQYVYDALRAGASGFLLKDAPLDELAAGVRTVARGDSLLSPAVTRTLIGRYADRVQPVAPAGGPLDRLAPRELEVLKLIAGGLSNAEIAAELVLGVETVKTYVSRILTKLDLRDRVQAVVLAYRTGLVSAAG
ncbi:MULTISPECIES: response regulator transcription factor [unclassified Amycolatopsis]|uniref:response regulator transcription factor n=1 Tax=unclassified Amycolatopsis TaxID=2618356 RepID=UPI0028744728|nr:MULTISPECIES: response regulator transcription factor [unclassified Amycolatopsis]MDS0135864.1 response regulator transcription factor [Amycolatopsis sp. 505]MDS0145547.1 response regulator transcription factor [Amycolatopsis sp. CM201R]